MGFIFPWQTLAGNQNDLVLSGDGSHGLSGYLEYYNDPTGKQRLEDILEQEQSQLFKPIPGSLNRGYTADASWVRFTVRRDEHFPPVAYLWLDHPYIDNATVYLEKERGSVSESAYLKYTLGDNTPVSERPLQHTNMVVPLELDDTLPHKVFIRVQTTSTLSISGRILTTEELVGRSQVTIFLQGGYLVLALTLGCINFFLAVRLRDSSYAFYSGYLFTLGARQFGAEGINTLLLPSIAHLSSDILVSYGSSLNFSLFSLFVIKLFETKTRFPIIHRYFQVICITGIAGCFTTGTVWYGYLLQALLLNAIFFSCVLLVLAIILIKQKVPAATLYLIAFTPSTLGGIITFMRILGVLPVNWFTSNSFIIGSVFHMILTTLALSERVLTAEKKALVASQQAEKKAVSLAEEMTRELQLKQKQLEDALTKEKLVRRSQSQFIDTISHEYRTPLAILQANVDILSLLRIEENGFKDILAKMKRAIKRLKETFDTGIQKGAFEGALNIEPVIIDLESFFEDLLREAKIFWGRTFHLQIRGAHNIAIQGDPAFLKTAFWNVLDNSVKYSPRSSTVRVCLHAHDKKVTVSVINERLPGEMVEAEKYFEKFYRGPNVHDRPGTGVGLYLARRIISQHDGQIHLDIGATECTNICDLPIIEERVADE